MRSTLVAPHRRCQRVSRGHLDLLEWEPPPETFDLVTSQFIHFAPTIGIGCQAAGHDPAAVKPQGTILIVGHDPSDSFAPVKRWKSPGGLHTACEVAALLDPALWTLAAVATRPRAVTDPQGHTTVVHDAVVRARRAATDRAE